MILANIGDPGGEAEEESLHGNDVNCIDHGVTIHIGSRQPASRQRSSEVEEMSLRGDHIHGVDVIGTWRPSSLGWRHGIAPAGRQRAKRVVAGAVGQDHA